MIKNKKVLNFSSVKKIENVHQNEGVEDDCEMSRRNFSIFEDIEIFRNLSIIRKVSSRGNKSSFRVGVLRERETMVKLVAFFWDEFIAGEKQNKDYNNLIISLPNNMFKDLGVNKGAFWDYWSMF
jgi:hypothetical protein